MIKQFAAIIALTTVSFIAAVTISSITKASLELFNSPVVTALQSHQ